jgi:hypothetical protein
MSMSASFMRASTDWPRGTWNTAAAMPSSIDPRSMPRRWVHQSRDIVAAGDLTLSDRGERFGCGFRDHDALAAGGSFMKCRNERPNRVSEMSCRSLCAGSVDQAFMSGGTSKR